MLPSLSISLHELSSGLCIRQRITDLLQMHSLTILLLSSDFTHTLLAHRCCLSADQLPTQAFAGSATAFLSAWLFHLGAPRFAIGSCIGFVLGTGYYWHHTMASSAAAYRNFPTLMVLHLRRNFPTFGFERYRVDASGDRGRRELRRFDERWKTDWTLRCLMMSAFMTAEPGIEVGLTLCFRTDDRNDCLKRRFFC